MQSNPWPLKVTLSQFSATTTNRKTIRSKYRLEVTNFLKYQQNLGLLNFFNCQFQCVHLNFFKETQVHSDKCNNFCNKVLHMQANLDHC